MLSDFYKKILSSRLTLHNEKELQAQIEKMLIACELKFMREYRLDSSNIPDFFLPDEAMAVEIKIKGGARKIYKQCERYCAFPEVQKLLLITNRSMGFPAQINSKDCIIINIGKAWL